MKTILIIGGAGFIGSNLCSSLVKNKDNRIISLDNYTTGSEHNHIDGIQYVVGEASEVRTLVKTKPDLIYHFGEYSRVEQSFDEPNKVWNQNSKSIFDVLDYALDCGAKILYSGSSTKFSTDKKTSISPYSWAKETNTELLNNYGKWFGLKYAIVYFYNAYGPNEIKSGRYATLIAKFIDQYKNNQPLTVVSPGTQKRNFTHVSDIVSAIELVAEHGVGDGYGIGSSEKFSVLEVAEKFNAEIKFLPERRGNRTDTELLIEKTINLGWKCEKNLNNYIEEMINTR